MRRLAQELGVVPMALYKHVANKEELLDGMVEAMIGEIDPPAGGADWKNTVRLRVLSARQALLRHPWARPVLESRTNKTPTVLGYMDSFAGMFLAGGFSADLTHHVMHALGSRMWGFTQELFDSPDGGTVEAVVPAEAQAAMFRQMAEQFPNIAAIATTHGTRRGFRGRDGLRRPVRVRVRPRPPPRRFRAAEQAGLDLKPRLGCGSRIRRGRARTKAQSRRPY